MTENKKPKLNSGEMQKEIDKLEEQLKLQEEQLKKLTLDEMNKAPKQESEGPKISQKEINNSKDIHLKPKRTIFAIDRNTGKAQKFNEAFRKNWEFDKEEVYFVAEHKEMQGEVIETWTRPYGGIPAEYWEVPTGVPVWGPRYLAEQIRRKTYHRLVMKQNVITEENSVGQMYGAMAADSIIPRLEAHPVSKKRSIFMGDKPF